MSQQRKKPDAFKGQQIVLIENEFGEIGIDGGFLKEAGIKIQEETEEDSALKAVAMMADAKVF